jgi:hypothetical protein
MNYADRVDYTTLSPRILSEISNIESSKVRVIGNNVQALLIDKYEEDNAVYYVTVNTYRSPEIAIHAKSSDDALTALKWFRDNGYKSTSFKDNEYSDARDYTLESVDDSSLKITLNCYFASGVCQFVDEPVDGEFEEIAELPAVAAVPAHKRQVMKRVLKCGTTDVPTVA